MRREDIDSMVKELSVPYLAYGVEYQENETFFDLGFDSLDTVALYAEAEEEADLVIEIAEADLDNLTTPFKLAEHIDIIINGNV